jgi:hypothetical protein
MNYQSNPQLELAFDYVANTHKNIFLTGKAGTGKTTFLQFLKRDSLKRMAVVAPTGVAAINAGGMTIHSFFQLPFGLFLPSHQRDLSRQRRFTKDKIHILQSLDLLVIDEISMVRADMLDAIDDVLRRFRNRSLPFGGVQLLMIGDLHQLPPVVKDDEWELMSVHYQTPYFFSSHALQLTEPISIELKHIYRQSDEAFIHLLNQVRENRITSEILDKLNSRYVEDFVPPEHQPYITLTSHNAGAQAINTAKLQSVKGEVYLFRANINGDFPEQAFPAEQTLELKIGAQVMFLRNDSSREKRYYNGKIGRIVKIQSEEITIRCPEDKDDIIVVPAIWKNLRYVLDEATKEIREDELGTFMQFPLRLAWAITIHKSQGLTFDRAIIDAQSAFAHGQVYVALSRCKSFEGIVLRSPIQFQSVRTDSAVQQFSAEVSRNEPDEAQLQVSKRQYQEAMLLELFDFKRAKRQFEELHRTILSHEHSLQGKPDEVFEPIFLQAEQEIFGVAPKFQSQLRSYFPDEALPENNVALQERMRKACSWFLDKTGAILSALENVPILTDNKTVKKAAHADLEAAQKELFIKNACMKASADGFSTKSFNRARADAEIDFKPSSSKQSLSDAYADAPRRSAHPGLYVRLQQWRDGIAETYDLLAYEVLSTKSILEIVEMLPGNLKALKRVKGIGEGKAKRFGQAILDIVNAYCVEKGLAGAQLALVEDSPPKLGTKELTLDLYRSGKSVEEIAEERGLVVGTIYTHIKHWVGENELRAEEIIGPEKFRTIMEIMEDNPDMTMSELKFKLGDQYTFEELGVAKAGFKNGKP